ncbi:MAG: HD domain-containing protein [Patescibacteria group bacterium]
MVVSQNLVQKTAEYVKQKLIIEHTGHDWYHVERVWQMAKRIQKAEGGNLELVELAVLLHEFENFRQQYQTSDLKGPFILLGMMDVLDIDKDVQDKIVKIIDESQFNGSETRVPSTIEGRIVQDADWLETIGALGIARIFATGGYIQRMIHDPKRKPRRKMSKKDYQLRKREGTSFNYFYEKAFKLPKLMNTKLGKAIALKREQYLHNFIEEFLAEWDGEK